MTRIEQIDADFCGDFDVRRDGMQMTLMQQIFADFAGFICVNQPNLRYQRAIK